MSLDKAVNQDAKIRAACLLNGNESEEAEAVRRACDHNLYYALTGEEKSALIEKQNEWSALEDKLLVLAYRFFLHADLVRGHDGCDVAQQLEVLVKRTQE